MSILSRWALCLELDSQSSYSGGPPLRKTPLGTTGSRCYSPLTVFQTPPPIKEEAAPPQALTQRVSSACVVEGASSLGRTPSLIRFEVDPFLEQWSSRFGLESKWLQLETDQGVLMHVNTSTCSQLLRKKNQLLQSIFL